MLKKLLGVAVPVLLALSTVACGTASGTFGNGGNGSSSGQTITLNLSTPDPDTAEITVAAKHYADLVNKESNGTIQIKVFPNGTLYGGDSSAAVKQLGAGSIDMLALSSSLYANFQPKFSVISIPYLFTDENQSVSYLNSDLGQQLLKSVDSMGIQPLGFWPRPFRQITNSKRPINTPDDLKGIRLRVPNNPLWVNFFKATGAVTTPMNFSEVYNALQLHTIDGQENPISIPRDSKFYEVQKYLTISNHMADAWVVGLNQKKYDSLTSQQQQVLMHAAQETQSWKLTYDSNQQQSIMSFLQSQGMQVNTLTPEQTQAFAAISQQQYPTFKGLVKDDQFFSATLKFVGKAN